MYIINQTVFYAELYMESNGVFSFLCLVFRHSDQNARAISMTEVQKFNKNINLTIEGTCRIWLNVELHEESNDVFSFFIYRAENNLQTNWFSVAQIRRRALLSRNFKNSTKIVI